MSAPVYVVSAQSHAATPEEEKAFKQGRERLEEALERVYCGPARLREGREDPDWIVLDDSQGPLRVRVNSGPWASLQVFVIRAEIVSDALRAYYGS